MHYYCHECKRNNIMIGLFLTGLNYLSTISAMGKVMACDAQDLHSLTNSYSPTLILKHAKHRWPLDSRVRETFFYSTTATVIIVTPVTK